VGYYEIDVAVCMPYYYGDNKSLL